MELAGLMSEDATAAARPPRSEPTNKKFFLPTTTGRIERSQALLSMSRMPDAQHPFEPTSEFAEHGGRLFLADGERGAADAERDIRGFALKFYIEEGNWDLVGNNTPVFFLRDPLKFPDLNHAVKRDPRTNLRSAKNNWDFWKPVAQVIQVSSGGSA